MKRSFIYFSVIALVAIWATFSAMRSKKKDFKTYLSGFTAAQFPLEICGDKDRPNDTAWYDNMYSYKEFVPELKVSDFGRDVSSNGAFVAKLFENEKVSTVCYKIHNYLADTLGDNRYYMVSYNMKTGITIDKKEIARQSSPKEYSRATITADRLAIITTYQRTWKNDPVEKGYSGNELAGIKTVSTKAYRIKEDGHFEKTEVPASYAITDAAVVK